MFTKTLKKNCSIFKLHSVAKASYQWYCLYKIEAGQGQHIRMVQWCGYIKIFLIVKTLSKV